jgi:DNA-binding IclR family transcriptional regulator
LPTSNDHYFSKSLEKGLKILSLFHEQKSTYSQTEISRILGLNMTSTYRFINTLVQLGYLNKDAGTKKLKLGVRALALSSTLLRTFDHHRIIRSLIDDVFEKYNITVDVALRVDDALAIVYRREAEDTLIHRLPSVSRSWHATALGKAFLAYLPAEERTSLIETLSMERRTDRTITTKATLSAELDKTRERGYAVANEEFLPGLIAIGVPVINLDTGVSMGSVSFDFSTIQQTVDSMVETYAELLMQLGGNISRTLTAL